MAEVSPERLIKVFIKIKEAREEMKREFDEKDKPLEAQQKQIKAALLDICNELNTSTLKVNGVGRITRMIKKKYWASDWEALHNFIMDRHLPEFFQKSLNQSNVATFMEENPEVDIPGLHIDSEYQLSVYKK